MEEPRHIVLRDTINHLAHHRASHVYLRLNEAKVPAIYGHRRMISTSRERWSA